MAAFATQSEMSLFADELELNCRTSENSRFWARTMFELGVANPGQLKRAQKLLPNPEPESQGLSSFNCFNMRECLCTH